MALLAGLAWLSSSFTLAGNLLPLLLVGLNPWAKERPKGEGKEERGGEGIYVSPEPLRTNFLPCNWTLTLWVPDLRG